MGYIGQAPANKALTSADIEDGIVVAADIADDSITLAKMASGTDGNVISYDASGNPVAIATGNDGMVLTSAGAGQPPAFEAVSAGTALTGSTNNTIPTVTGANAISGEANLTFDGTNLSVSGGIISAGSGTGKKLLAYDASGTKMGLGIDMSGASSELSIFSTTTGSTGIITFGKRNSSTDAFVESMRITNTDTVGIGETAPLGKLHVKSADSGASVDANSDELVLEGSSHTGMTILSGTSHSSRIDFGDSGGTQRGGIDYYHGGDYLRFLANGAEAMRIDNNNTFLVNATDKDTALNGNVLRGYQYFAGNIEASTNDYASMFIKHTSAKMHGIVIRDMHSSGTQIDFTNSAGTRVGVINQDGSNTAYNTSSDYRLKENETPITDGIDRVKQLKPYRLNYKIEPDKTVDAFFAHEVSSVVPEAVTGDKDAMMFEKDGITPILDEDENNPQQKIDVQQLDQAKLVPLLTSALKEAITKIETLETKVTALENA